MNTNELRYEMATPFPYPCPSVFICGRIYMNRLLVLLVAEIAFFNTSSLTAKITQVIKLRTTDAAATNDVDVIDDRRVKRENAFDADAEADLADGHRFTNTAMFAGDHDAFKNLNTFLVAFLDADVNLDGVARLERRNVFLNL